MKEFDLQAAQRGAKVVTNIGQPAQIIRWDLKSDYPILALVIIQGQENALQFTREGHFFSARGNKLDLMMLTDEHGDYVYNGHVVGNKILRPFDAYLAIQTKAKVCNRKGIPVAFTFGSFDKDYSLVSIDPKDHDSLCIDEHKEDGTAKHNKDNDLFLFEEI